VLTVGLVANPVSAHDIRRVIANASSLQIADRANIVLRVLAGLAAAGVPAVMVMPDRKGITALLERNLARERNLGRSLPDVRIVDMPVTTTVDDTLRATAEMADAGVAAIVVLGGDGTHRAVVRRCGKVPVAGLSTGTNNAFPEMREPTITGLAVGLYASGAIPAEEALLPNKVLEVSVNDGERADVALVDVVISREPVVGARALWRTDHLEELFVTFADPEAIGMSSIAGLLRPVGRREPFGLRVRLDSRATAPTLRAPIAPGLIEPVAVAASKALPPDETVTVSHHGGVVALDGERELELRAGDHLTVTLRCDAFRSIDVPGCMRAAAVRGLFHHHQPNERGTHG
jgi:predicted polyphosphate/ATP-dependent NAD kinase